VDVFVRVTMRFVPDVSNLASALSVPSEKLKTMASALGGIATTPKLSNRAVIKVVLTIPPAFPGEAPPTSLVILASPVIPTFNSAVSVVASPSIQNIDVSTVIYGKSKYNAITFDLVRCMVHYVMKSFILERLLRMAICIAEQPLEVPSIDLYANCVRASRHPLLRLRHEVVSLPTREKQDSPRSPRQLPGLTHLA